MNKISGKIINYNETFSGEVLFDKYIKDINKIESSTYDQYIIPGFIDPHCHGAINHDTMQGLESIKKMADFHLSKGTTTLLPTTLTNSIKDTLQALDGFNDLLLNDNNNIEGVHLEGPFINPNKLGAQPPLTQKPNISFIKEIQKIAKIRTVTLAPELEGADILIEYLAKNKINIQFGHSLATDSCCKHFMSKHLVSFTHLYNAMSGNDHHNPGVVSAALEFAEYAEIICDLKHVAESSIKIAHKCIPKLYAVTDSIGATGMSNGLYTYGNLSVVKKDNIATLKDSNTLAGSVMNMYETFLNLKKMQFSMQEIVALTSYNASQFLNEKKIGIIKSNYKSNFLILDNKLKLKEIYLNGINILNN